MDGQSGELGPRRFVRSPGLRKPPHPSGGSNFAETNSSECWSGLSGAFPQSPLCLGVGWSARYTAACGFWFFGQLYRFGFNLRHEDPATPAAFSGHSCRRMIQVKPETLYRTSVSNDVLPSNIHQVLRHIHSRMPGLSRFDTQRSKVCFGAQPIKSEKPN